ncbi:hypothetical protein KHA80_21925 [Anaerobacillus sp. HL2]|nr:hypothetical protein KHA80_21925 [Anaerobacillus sp. HL2]
MPKFRRKPIVVEAVKINSPITINTHEETLTGNVGDYLITHADGAQYPCDAKTFEETYEPIKFNMNVKSIAYKVIKIVKYKTYKKNNRSFINMKNSCHNGNDVKSNPLWQLFFCSKDESRHFEFRKMSSSSNNMKYKLFLK